MSGPTWQSNPQLVTAVQGYSAFVKQNTADLVSHTQTFCQAISAGNMNQAKVLYPPARVYYERIEPVAVGLGQPGHQHRRHGGRTR